MDVFELLDKNFDLCKQVDALNVMIYREKILFYGVSHFSFAQIFEKFIAFMGLFYGKSFI